MFTSMVGNENANSSLKLSFEGFNGSPDLGPVELAVLVGVESFKHGGHFFSVVGTIKALSSFEDMEGELLELVKVKVSTAVFIAMEEDFMHHFFEGNLSHALGSFPLLMAGTTIGSISGSGRSTTHIKFI